MEVEGGVEGGGVIPLPQVRQRTGEHVIMKKGELFLRPASHAFPSHFGEKCVCVCVSMQRCSALPSFPVGSSNASVQSRV